MTRERLRRNQRAKVPPPMQFTDRDLEIIRLVAAFRHATRQQIQELLFSPTTTSYAKHRLMLLYQHGLLERRFLPLRAAFGAALPYYELSSKGADLLSDVTEVPRAELDWRPRDGRREPLYMEHTLRINDVRAVLLAAARSAALELSWTDERELKRRANAYRVPDPLKTDSIITIIPDGYFTLGGSAFALELDRATVEEGPFKRKIRGYGAFKTSGVYNRAFGTDSLRVLFVVTDAKRDQQRLSRIRRWTEHANGATLFWFANLDELTPESALFGRVWDVAGYNSKGALFKEPEPRTTGKS